MEIYERNDEGKGKISIYVCSDYKETIPFSVSAG
jgi:hypothetical protein